MDKNNQNLRQVKTIKSGRIYLLNPIDNTTAGSTIAYPSPFNRSIHNSLDSFTGSKLEELPDDLRNEAPKINIQFIQWEIEEHKKQWEQQRRIFQVIFGMVVLLTLSGIGLSIYQLYISANLNKLETLVTEVGFEKANILNIKSSIVGITILVISIIFFYLFLQFIYRTKTSSETIHRELAIVNKGVPEEFDSLTINNE